MTNVWALFPSATVERAAASVKQYSDKGYKVGVLVDYRNLYGKELPAVEKIIDADILLVKESYDGYWRSINLLVKTIKPEIVLATADDIDPDPNHTADEIAAMYFERFPDGMGLMQPCADRQGDLMDGKWNSQRICGSPWFGRGWIERAYQGKGPMPTSYHSFFGDEELQHVALKLGALYQREDLTQMHRHHSWGHRPVADYNQRNQLRWHEDQAIFLERKKNVFPGHEPRS